MNESFGWKSYRRAHPSLHVNSSAFNKKNMSMCYLLNIKEDGFMKFHGTTS